MTVSRVINKSGYVRKETEQGVRQAIAKLGFRPNEIARLLRGGLSKTIGIIVPDLGDSFFATCANEAQKVAASHGYLSLIASAERDEAHEADEIELMRERNISGLLIVPTRRGWPTLLELYARDLPIVAFDRQFPEFPCDDVLVDNVEGAYQATRHLLDHGHTHIACLGFDEVISAVQDRINGYRKAMREANLREHISTAVNSLEQTIDQVRTWRQTRDGPTAIFTLNNVTTLNVHLAFKQFAINIPQDYAVIGFDDLDYWTLFACPVTAVRQPTAELGKRAAEMLFARLASPEPTGSGHQHVVLPVGLIIRNSCGCMGTERTP
jgi:LacI family transcriptional regulator